ncbi:MAG: S9 family peptidase [Muribaculaceae bacterium]|nr:S9 family peptidase [Muribaculaceae bacterium]
MVNLRKLIYVSLLTALSLPAIAQGTLEDYNRAFGLARKYNYGYVPNARITPHWIEGTDKFWYIDESPDGARSYTVVDAAKRKRSPLFDAKSLADAFKANGIDNVDLRNPALERLRVSANLDTLWFDLDGRMWTFIKSGKYHLADRGAVTTPPAQPHWMVVDEEKDFGPVTSPDGSKVAFVRDHNLCVRDLKTGVVTQLTTDGTIGNYYSSYIYWAPDSRKFAVNKIKPVEKRYVYYVESSPAQGSQPILHKQEYAKPGDELRFKLPVIADVEKAVVIVPDTRMFDRQYDLYGPMWNADSEAITFEYNERGHKNYRILEMSASDGTVRPLVEESHDKYVNYSRIFRHYLEDGKRIIWSSERDNFNHLYMYDRTTGKATHQITKGDWYVRDVVNVDEKNGKIYFSANGVNKDEDPYFIRYYVINFDGTGMTDLTPAPGTHRAVFSPDFKYLVDTYSTVSSAPVTCLRDASSGKVIMDVAVADLSALIDAGWKAPEVFVAPGRDGKTPMWGVIYRPSNFDENKKYPIVEYIYQGPGDQYVPKSFVGLNRNMSALAELGFIVVMVDGMGTSFRSREFENVCYKNLVDAGLPDHISWIKAAGEKYPYMDIERVGIFGASAGGQESTTAVLHHPEFYKAAYSACGCHDNRMDKIWWNEQWLGYPIDDSYIEASNVENAHLLSRPLMLVVGELDDNVDPASTMQVADALIKANKDFELVVIPGAAHTLGESFGEHKRYDFFVRHLMGVNPPAWTDIEY